jgi:hypothetical protein
MRVPRGVILDEKRRKHEWQSKLLPRNRTAMGAWRWDAAGATLAGWRDERVRFGET